jgi:uncharacterized protein YijF (DUF1287 family)
VQAARAQIGVTVRYDSSYVKLPYPNGDVPLDRGVCSDVVIRAYRQAGVDLQALVHEDMLKAWGAYPRLWGLSRPDTNIDHRRVPNLVVFFSRHGEVLTRSREAAAFRAGDIVTWQLPSGVPHIGIVSDKVSRWGAPLVIHNIGAGAVEEDALFVFKLTGHYRYVSVPATAGR